MCIRLTPACICMHVSIRLPCMQVTHVVANQHALEDSPSGTAALVRDVWPALMAVALAYAADSGAADLPAGLAGLSAAELQRHMRLVHESWLEEVMRTGRYVGGRDD